jgi:predicted ATPase
LPSALASLLCTRASGNPAFLVKLVDHWLARGWLSDDDGHWSLRCSLEALARDIPSTIVELVESECERLGSLSRSILEVASVAGPEFSVASVAGALCVSAASVEDECLELARDRRFLQSSEGVDGAEGAGSPCFSFIHALQREVIYQRLGVARRRQLERYLAASARHMACSPLVPVLPSPEHRVPGNDVVAPLRTRAGEDAQATPWFPSFDGRP